jgi:retron-type reverse transcriptase
MMFETSVDQQLLDKRRYQRALDRLALRAKSNADYARSAPVFRQLSLKWILHNRDQVIREICQRVARGYEFSTSARVVLVDASKKSRDIYVQSWPDRIVLMVLAEILSEQTSSHVPPTVYSFRKGLGTTDALNAFLKFQKTNQGRSIVVLKRDVSKYGDSIPQQPLLDKVQATLGLRQRSRLLCLLERALRMQFYDAGHADQQQCLRVGVPSGSPIVPPLENFYLIELDAAMAGFSGGFYARYGDDFIFAHVDPLVCKEADQRIESLIAQLGLTIKEEKKLNVTLGQQQSHGFDWLGARVNFESGLGFKQKKTQQMQSSVVKLADSLIARIAGIQNESQKLEVLKQGLRQILDAQKHLAIAPLVYQRRHRATLVQFDRVFVHQVVRSLARHWGLGKRPAWRLFRSLRLKTLTKSVFVKKVRHVEKAAA